MKILLKVFLICSFSFITHSIFFYRIVHAENSEISMNGYSRQNFGDFSKTWKLVTVRYRKDSGEMRFTYANDLAWEVLSNNKTEYPDGAVFGKIGMMTQPDISFPSSAMPSGARRVQFMIRNKQKHASTNGWGYALFDSNGKTFPGDQDQATIACNACHNLVPERNFVFSQIMGEQEKIGANFNWESKLKFAEIKSKDLPFKLKQYLKKEVHSIFVLQHPISKNVFYGTLDEIRPLLAEQAVKKMRPTALISEDKKLFSIVIPYIGTNMCEGTKNSIPMKGIHTLEENSKKTYETNFCQKKSDL